MPTRAAQGSIALLVLSLAHVAGAQTREEIVGYDPASGTLASIELTPSGVPGFDQVALVETTSNGAHRTPMTTDVDAQRVRSAGAATDARTAIQARVAHDVAALRARFASPGAIVPVAPPPGAECVRAPFASRDVAIGTDLLARITVSPDGTGSRVALVHGSHVGVATELPATTLNEGATIVHAPYDRVVDARALPGTDTMALLFRTDACMPQHTWVPAHAALVAPPPPPEVPLVPLPHAELTDAVVVRAVAPHARRRTVDTVAGWFDGRDRVVFDTAWQLPDGRYLAQYTRQQADLPPTEADAGRAYARFAVLDGVAGGHAHVAADLAPPIAQNVFEGTGQEAFGADLDGDGRPEVVVRAHYQPDAEATTVLRVAPDALEFVWRMQSRADERAAGTAAQPEVRRCTEGLDGHDLVMRCTIERYRAGAPADAQPVARERLVDTLRWNGGAIQLGETRR